MIEAFLFLKVFLLANGVVFAIIAASTLWAKFGEAI